MIYDMKVWTNHSVAFASKISSFVFFQEGGQFDKEGDDHHDSREDIVVLSCFNEGLDPFDYHSSSI